jgi:hypothetical protein
MSIRAYATEQELSEKLINNGIRQVAQELDRFFQPANRGALIAAFWGRSGKLAMDKVVAGRPGKVTKAQRRAAKALVASERPRLGVSVKLRPQVLQR